MALGEKVKQTLIGAFESIADLFLWPIQKGIEWGLETFFDLLGKRLAPRLKPLLDALDATGEVPPELRPLVDEMRNPSGEVAALMGQSLSSGLIGGVTSSILTPILGPLAYQMNRTRPVAILGPGEEILADFRGLLGTGWFEDVLASHGYNETNRNLLRDINRPLLSQDAVRQLSLRQEVVTVNLDKELGGSGLTPERIDALKKLWQVLPPLSDITTMAMRLAFSPESRSYWPWAYKAPADFVERAAKLGLSREWCEYYWFIHWQQPGITLQYEMLQRGEITQEDVRRTLWALGYSDWWIPHMIAVSYNPLTRVDVRRMHDFLPPGSIDLVRRYQDLGFDKDNAKLMADFTIAYNQAANRDLTKSDIQDGLQKGLLSPLEAEEDLKALGYDPDEIAFYIERVDLKKEESVKSQLSTRYRKLYVKNLIDEATLRAEMVPLGFSAGEITELIRLWDIEKRSQKETTFEEKERDLARADVTDGYRRQIFSSTEARDLLDKLGYDADEIDFYLTREDYKRDEALAEDMVTSYRRQFLQGVIDEAQVRMALVGIPLPPEQISHLLALWRLDKESQEWAPIVPVQRDLTKADILDAYRKRILPLEDITRMLAELGYDLAETDVLISKTELQGEKEKRELSLTTYRTLYTTGVLDKTSTTAALADLGFEEQEIELLYELWDIQMMERLKMPSRSDLTRFLKKNIINTATWRTLMAQMGYPDPVINWYQEDMEE